MKELTSCDVLHGARALVAKGHCKGAFYKKEGKAVETVAEADQFCIMGAIYHAAEANCFWPTNLTLRVRKLVETQLTKQLSPDDPNRLACLVWWNDETARTQAEVVALLDNTIAANCAEKVNEQV